MNFLQNLKKGLNHAEQDFKTFGQSNNFLLHYSL